MNKPITDYKPQFITTRSVLNGLISVSWAILVLLLVLGLFSGASNNFGASVVMVVMAGFVGAIAIAVLSSIFIGVICLIDIRNMTAEKHYRPATNRPPQAPRRPPPPQQRRDPDIDRSNWT